MLSRGSAYAVAVGAGCAVGAGAVWMLATSGGRRRLRRLIRRDRAEAATTAYLELPDHDADLRAAIDEGVEAALAATAASA